MFDKIFRIFLSRRFAVTLLIVMAACLVVGTSLPDLDAMSPEETAGLHAARPILFQVLHALQMQSLISSPYFLIMPLLIFVSTMVCTVKRLLTHSRKEGGFHCERSGRVRTGMEKAVSLLSSQGWSVSRKDGVVAAVKGGFGFRGSLLFHVGLLIIFVAVAVSAFTQFNAEILLTENFPVSLGPEAFVKIHKGNGLASLPPAVLELKRFVPQYEQERFATDFSAELLIDGLPSTIHVNRPAEINGFQLSLHRFGFSPSFRITDRHGKEILNANINLVVVGGKGDSFAVPDTSYVIHTEFFPDFYNEKGKYGSRSAIPKNPVFLISIASNGRETERKFIALGETVAAGDLIINFNGLSYWVDLIVARDYGIWVFALGMAAVVLGLALRFAIPDKEIEARFEGDTVYFKGWSKYFPAFFEEEMDELLKKMTVQEYNKKL